MQINLPRATQTGRTAVGPARSRWLFLALVTLCGAATCGQKGPLYLPDASGSALINTTSPLSLNAEHHAP